MNRKQRIHSAELRRLDHIARSLDRIGDALERLPETIVSGNNDRVLTIGGNVSNKAQLSMQDIINETIGHDGVNVNGSNGITIQRGDNDNIQGDGNRYVRDINGNDNNVTSGDNSDITEVRGPKMTIGRGVGLNTGLTKIDAEATQNYNDEVSGGSMPMGDLHKVVATYGENSQGIVDGTVDYNQSPNKPGTG